MQKEDENVTDEDNCGGLDHQGKECKESPQAQTCHICHVAASCTLKVPSSQGRPAYFGEEEEFQGPALL